MGKHTQGPWPVDYTGDGKRIIVGPGLVEGPNGYDVAEVYSDDCPREVAEANASLIAAAPELLDALKDTLECAEQLMLRLSPDWDGAALEGSSIFNARAAIAKATGAAE